MIRNGLIENTPRENNDLMNGAILEDFFLSQFRRLNLYGRLARRMVDG